MPVKYKVLIDPSATLQLHSRILIFIIGQKYPFTRSP